MADLEIYQFPCLSDNYGVLIHDPQSLETAAIDTPDAGTIQAALEEKGWQLTHILNTHHHADHTQGNAALKKAFNCTIIAPEEERSKIEVMDVGVNHGDTVNVCGRTFHVIKTAGHTLGHITYHAPADDLAFAGDSLFPLGCGRMFEGTPDMMWEGLDRLRNLPPETIIYCGHEYTEANARFAVTVDPDNSALQDRYEQIKAQRADGLPTVPTTLAIELETNPFLRVDNPAIQANLSMAGAEHSAVFAEIRRRKDNF
ncbi:hydroxyacylglutathione hydrolase [Coralliovum pocilloporae]|uniref:hydroxyacylglutathione hydrolase n=1 Tax=Coralliovum pocilloporae TaxID=3066369 RepID=UPI0033070602